MKQLVVNGWMARTTQTSADLEENLQEQIHFLKTSAARFDRGDTHEAKRIAVAVRILCHESRSSHSLLGQLDYRQSRKLLSSAEPIDPANELAQSGLTGVALGRRGGWFAPLDDAPHHFLTVDDWWNEEVLWDRASNPFARSALVLAMANQDGGAHVDPALDAAYAQVKEGLPGWMVNGNAKGLRHPERFAVRQIGHEIIKSLDPQYRRKARSTEGAKMRNPRVSVHNPGEDMLPIDRSGHYENSDPDQACPCGSGLSFKDCHQHGAPPIWPVPSGAAAS